MSRPPAGRRPPPIDDDDLRAFRERTLYRLLIRARRAENTEMVARIRERGYDDFLPSYPALLANLDTAGTTISALAAKAGITRQAAGQMLREIESRGYVERSSDPDDARAVLIRRTERGRALLRDALEVVSELEGSYARAIGKQRFAQLCDLLGDLVEHIDPAGRLGRA